MVINLIYTPADNMHKSSFVFQNLVFHPNIQFCLDCMGSKLFSSLWAIAFSEMKNNMDAYDEKQKNKQNFGETVFQYFQLSMYDKYFSINKTSL